MDARTRVHHESGHARGQNLCCAHPQAEPICYTDRDTRRQFGGSVLAYTEGSGAYVPNKGRKYQ